MSVAIARERKQVLVDRELTKLHEKHGNITEAILLNEARDPEHPLHHYFEWDDTIAAENYRRNQALAMIMASKMVVVLQQQANAPPTVIRSEQPEVRRLVSAFRGEGFVMRTDALADADQRAAIVERHKSRLRGWCRETSDIEELSSLREVILRQLDDD